MEPTTPAGPAPRSNPAGVGSLVAGVLLLLFGFVRILMSQVLPLVMDRWQLSFSQVNVWLQLAGGITAVIALVAVILGVIGLLLPGRRRTAAIIGTTLGASQLASTVVGLLGSLLVRLALS